VKGFFCVLSLFLLVACRPHLPHPILGTVGWVGGWVCCAGGTNPEGGTPSTSQEHHMFNHQRLD
jgi:hypothetical protein